MNRPRVAVLGLGYVGCVMAACLAAIHYLAGELKEHPNPVPAPPP
jgi:hypothetical protein